MPFRPEFNSPHLQRCVSKDGDFVQKIELKVAFILASWGVVKATFLNTRNYSILY